MSNPEAQQPSPPPPPPPSPPPPVKVAPELTVEQQMGRRTRRAFLRGGLYALGAFGGWSWLRSREAVNGIPWPFRKTHEFNEWLWSRTFSPKALAPEFPRDRAGRPPANGSFGRPSTAPGTWIVEVDTPGRPPRKITLDDLNVLPRVEMTTEFKCIEGWSQIVTWGGVRLADFLDHFQLGQREDGSPFPFIGLATPNGTYYVGLDLASARHPQTLLCDSMNEERLPAEHGGPLRLVITVKYGIKNLKWLSKIHFADQRPADYWAERGYDWYAGL